VAEVEPAIDVENVAPEHPREGLKGRIRPRLGLSVVAIVILVAGICDLAWATVGPTRPPAQVYSSICSGTFGAFNISYLGNQSGFLSTEYFVEPYYCYVALVSPNSIISLGFGLHSYDLANSHVVQTFSVLPPYSLAAFSPSVPAGIAAGGNLSFAVTVHVPTTGGSDGAPIGSLTVL
jgi:hypothetical protein